MLKKLFLFFLLFLGVFRPLRAQQPRPELLQADSAFEAGGYPAAYQQYRKLLQQQAEASPRLLVRMAYVQEGLGHYPAALYYLSMALARQPRLATWRKMADLARSQRLTGYPENWQQDAQLIVRRYYYSGLQGLLFGAVVGGILLVRRRPRAPSWWAAYATYLLLTGAYVNLVDAERAALVVRPRAALMAGPSAGAAWLSTATTGDRLLIQGQQDIWYQVQWQGREAYIRTQDLLLVQ